MTSRVAALLLVTCLFSAFGATFAPVTQSDFVTPTVVTFSTPGGPYNSVSPYTEAGASFYADGGTYTFFGIFDLDALPTNTAMNLSVSFNQPYAQFGFYPNNPCCDISQFYPFSVDSVDFYSDASFTTLLGTYNTPTGPFTPGDFFGLRSSENFQSIVVHLSTSSDLGGFSPYLDDFQFEGSSAPEPASFAIMGLGLVGVALIGRKFRSR